MVSKLVFGSCEQDTVYQSILYFKEIITNHDYFTISKNISVKQRKLRRFLLLSIWYLSITDSKESFLSGKAQKNSFSHKYWKSNFLKNSIKVQFRFWEGHKNLTQSSSRFWRYLVMSKPYGRLGQIFVAFLEYLNFIKNIYLPMAWWLRDLLFCQIAYVGKGGLISEGILTLVPLPKKGTKSLS